MTDPNLSLVMIVRDEARNLPRCLSSVRGVADEVVVVDTGSTDDSAAVARGLGARVVERPWDDDFAAARNFAVDQARGRWVLVLDADEALAPGAGEALARYAVPWTSEQELPYYFGRLVHFADAGADPTRARLDYGKVTLFPRHPGFRFVQPVYEHLAFAGPPGSARREQAPDLAVFDYGRADPERRAARSAQNLAIATQALARDPDNDYLRFHLAREEHQRGEYRRALIEVYELLRRNAPEPRFSTELLGVAAYYGALSALQLRLHRDAAQLSMEGLKLSHYNPGLWQTVTGAYLYLRYHGDKVMEQIMDALLCIDRVPALSSLDAPIEPIVQPALFVVGYAHYINRDYEAAWHYFRRGCDWLLHWPMFPTHALLAALAADRLDEALALANRTAACYPQEADRLRRVQEDLRRLRGRPDEAARERVRLLVQQWLEQWPPVPGRPEAAGLPAS